MKTLSNFIQEGLKIGRDFKYKRNNYCPKTKNELAKLLDKLIKERGNKADLNDIDTSEITDMSELFIQSEFNGNISEWDVSNVEDMSHMFHLAKFNGDISKWDVSNVKDMYCMFHSSYFTGKNGDISKWNVRNVEDMGHMFEFSNFNQNIDNWGKFLSDPPLMVDMFLGCPLRKNPPIWYKN